MNKVLALSDTFANFRNMICHEQLQDKISFHKFLTKAKTFKGYYVDFFCMCQKKRIENLPFLATAWILWLPFFFEMVRLAH